MKSTTQPNLRPDSIVIHGGDRNDDCSAVAPPIFQTAAFRFEDIEEFEQMATLPLEENFYTRYGNPTLGYAASLIADLENAEMGMVCGSGMGASTTIAFALLKAGDHVICQRSVYTGIYGLFSELLPKLGVTCTFVDQRDPESFRQAIRPNTRMIWLETPTNPLLMLTDIREISNFGREHHTLTVCDNTVATPLGQKPLDLGVDLVVHSATKALSGHGDIIAGAVAGKRELLEKLWQAAIIIGATLAPFDAWLLMRGIRTLPLRIKRQSENAMIIASYLQNHPLVRTVHYPGLQTHPQHELAKQQMRSFGCLLSFELRASKEHTKEIIRRLRLVRLAVSLGGYETLIAKIGAVWKVHDGVDAAGFIGVPPTLLRLSVGLEDPQDIICDLAQALDPIEATEYLAQA